MKFCNECDNMLYIGIDAENTNQLTYFCRQCGTNESINDPEGQVILESHFKSEEHQLHHIINKYTKYDPTLPRIQNVKCPNKDCATNEQSSAPAEIIYLRYDDANMKYVYLCVECDTFWKTSTKQ